MLPALLVAALLPRLGSMRWTLATIVLAALLVRVLLLGVDPFLSDDLYRCLWDGEVQRAGLDPYLAAPSAPVLDEVASTQYWSTIRSQINHPDIPTVYPPLSQLVFRWAAYNETGWRSLLVLLDLLVGVILAVALAKLGQDPRRAVLWWWHPLPILECSIGGHPEIVAVLLTTLGIACLATHRGMLAAAAIGAGVSAKLLPIGWLPLLLHRIGRRAWIPFLALILVSVVPFFDSDLRLATVGLREYATSWYSGDLLYRPLGQLLGLDPENRFSTAAQGLRIFFLLCWGFVAWRCRKSSPWRAFLVVSCAFVVLSPTLHPWYLLWLLPAAVMEKSAAALALSWAVLFQYGVLDGWRATGVWEMPDGTLALVVALPVFFLIRQWRRERGEQVSIPAKE